MTDKIRDMSTLAAMLYDRGLEGRKCVLLPNTAAHIGAALKVSLRRPTRDEIMAIICERNCHDGRCQPCMNKANIISNAIREDGKPITSDGAYARYLKQFPNDWMRKPD